MEMTVPDVAVGRLRAASVEEVQSLVGKILAYESGEGDPLAPIVLITDNPDRAGNFDADAEEIASTILSEDTVEKDHTFTVGQSLQNQDNSRDLMVFPLSALSVGNFLRLVGVSPRGGGGDKNDTPSRAYV